MNKLSFELILNHYIRNLGNNFKYYLWDKGPIEKMPFEFRVLEFAPSPSRKMWMYATCGMSLGNDNSIIELHIFSTIQDESIIELLTSVTYYHHNTATLNINHTVNFGRPWQNHSSCEYGLISLPYLDGPGLENLSFDKSNKMVKFYWLIPITDAEVKYKIKFGVEALEKKFEEGLDYADSTRKSMIEDISIV